MESKDTGNCTVCESQNLYRRGYCQACYKRGLRDGSIERLRSRSFSPCIAPGCIDKATSKGHCGKHYYQFVRHGHEPGFEYDSIPANAQRVRSECSFQDCVIPAEARGLCKSHYGMLRNGRELRSLIDTECPVPGCMNPKRYRSGVCGTHYYYIETYGLDADGVVYWHAAERMHCHNPGCSRVDVKLHMDHDHKCCPQSKGCCGNCVRGWLCAPCNKALGLMKEDPRAIEGLLQYLM